MDTERQAGRRTLIAHVSGPSKDTIGSPPEASSILFWGRKRATTLILFALAMMVVGVWRRLRADKICTRERGLYHVKQAELCRCRPFQTQLGR